MTARCGTKTLIFTLLALLAITWSGLAGAADLKVGKVSIQTIYTKSARIKAEVQKMQQIQTDGQAKLTALASDLQNLQSKLNAAKTKEDKDKIEADMQAKSESLESERQSINVKLSFAQQSIRNKFTSELKKIIEDVAKSKGINLILEDSTLLYSAGATDITNDVLAELEKGGAPAAAGPKAAPKAPAAGPAKDKAK